MSEIPKSSFNRKRSSYISFLKRKNYQLNAEIEQFMTESLYIEKTAAGEIKRSRLTEDQIHHLMKLERSASLCSNYSLYAKNFPANDYTYIASGTCSHKCCFICNWHRQKSLRRKYLKWFNENPALLSINHKNKVKSVSVTQFREKYEPDGAVILSELPYDLMHLTLTVPHYADSGFNGQIYFYNRIIEMFNWMRKDKPWLNMVYGGEFGVETERKESGLHIHIHALLLVRRFFGNRNELHRYILKKWNALSINEYSTRDKISAIAREKIKLSNNTLTDDDINALNPKGATIIGLETIYTLINGAKVRATTWGSDAMIKAVMETISYHFEPHAFNKADGTINIPLLADLLPEVYKKILYKKFGCLHGEKALNISAEMDPEELKKDLQEAAELLVDEETGEIHQARHYFILNPAYVFHDKSADNKIILSRAGLQKMKPLEADSSYSAIRQMAEMIKATFKNSARDSNEITVLPESQEPLNN